MKKLLLLLTTICNLALGAEPPLMLLDSYENQNISGWVVSEKLDGVRGYWDGKQLISRQGSIFNVPPYFTANFPSFPIDGELFSERNQFEEISSITRSTEDKGWHKLKLYVFDVPQAQGNLFERLAVLENHLRENPTPYIQIIEQKPLSHNKEESAVQLQNFLKQVEALGGEGVVVRDPQAPYEAKRSTKILKFKTSLDEECIVIAHHKGKGQFENALGSLTCENQRGQFKIGSGFSLQDRINPPPIGSQITYKYRGLTKNGKPRFATYWRKREQ